MRVDTEMLAHAMRDVEEAAIVLRERRLVLERLIDAVREDALPSSTAAVPLVQSGSDSESESDNPTEHTLPDPSLSASNSGCCGSLFDRM